MVESTSNRKLLSHLAFQSRYPPAITLTSHVRTTHHRGPHTPCSGAAGTPLPLKASSPAATNTGIFNHARGRLT
jgi:hypothetical protein